jgi:hypothetical protein
MAVDINADKELIGDKTSVYQTYQEFRQSYDSLKKKAGDSFEEDKKFVSKVLSNFDRTKRTKQDNSCEPFLMYLVSQLKKLKGSGLQTDKQVKRIFINTLKETKESVFNLLIDEIKSTLSCSGDQSYQFNTAIHIPVSMVDLFGIFETSPTDKIGKLFYEQKPIQYDEYPFSLNRELYQRTQNANQTYSSVSGNNYLGKSVQNLFDMSYVESYLDIPSGQIIQGSFFKFELKPRQTFPTVDEFLSDYYSTIDIIEFKTFFTYLSNFVTGAVSFGQGEGGLKIASLQKALAINKRINCLCSDNTKEISVSSNSKVSEIDNTDDSFFELTDVELRIIEQNVSNIKLGVVEFEDCDNVKVPMNVEALLTALDNLQFNEDTQDVNEFEAAMNVINPVVDQGYKASVDMGFIEQFINALLSTILSPKTILPLMLMGYALNQQVPPDVKNLEDFQKKYRTFYIGFATKLIAKFTEKVFGELKKEILKLVALLNSDVLYEKKIKIEKLILSIVALLANPINAVLDFRECKGGIGELLKLLNLALKKKSSTLTSAGQDVPLPLLLASQLLDGYSSTRAFLNVIGNLEDIGVPTGPMPDGSPNKFVASIKAMIDGNSQEIAENGKVAIGIGPLTTTPSGITIPKDAYGKFI